MTTRYSAHPALASTQLELAVEDDAARHCSSGHRRHISPVAITASSSGNVVPPQPVSSTKSASSFSNPANLPAADAPRKTLPDRTAAVDFDDDGGHYDEVDGDIDIDEIDVDFADVEEEFNNTKDCVDCAPSAPPPLTCIDEADFQRQHCFSRLHQHNIANSTTTTTTHPHHQHCSRQHFQHDLEHSDSAYDCIGEHHMANSDGCGSGMSSTISSPTPSTVSSPLSTPTRFTPQHMQSSHQKVLATTAGACATSLSSTHQHGHQAAANNHQQTSGAGGCKKMQKLDPRFGPSPYRQLLPIALCILSFATVFSILIVYMDTTEIRHQQFRLNMSRDYELYGVAQDDPTLIAFLREIHMRKYPMHFLKNGEMPATADQHFNFSVHHDGLTPEMAHYVADLVGGKMNGAVIQSLPGALGQFMTAPWLAETLNWAGVIVEPEPRRYFALRKQNAQRPGMQVVHACVSPKPYPKEVSIHNEESEVRINSLLDEETSWFNSRVKSFPLYTIMLACNRVEYDLLSLGVLGRELQILQTLPFDKIKIEVISIHLPSDDHDELRLDYMQSITKFLMGKSYKLQKRFGRNYFYQRINSTSRTRKKDILLLKTP